MKKQHTNLCLCDKTPEQYPGFIFKHLHSVLTAAFCGILCTVIISCASSPEIPQSELFTADSLCPETVVWTSVCPGISRTDYSDKAIPLIWHAVKIDLSSPDILPVSWPDSELTGKSIKTLSFAEKAGTVIAVNTLPFIEQSAFFHINRYPVGLYISNGIIRSVPVGRYCALLFYKEADGSSKAQIIDSQNETASMPVPDSAFGGFWTILRDGKIKSFKAYRRARTAAGTADKGRTLYLLSVEGCHKNQSVGLTSMECAGLLARLGADTAMLFDSGHSSELCILENSVITHRVHRHVTVILGFKYCETLTNDKE